MTKIQHKRSSVLVSGAAKAPTSAQLDYGELAINYSSTDPQLFIKDSGGSVISILNSYAPLAGATFTGDVNFDGEAIIKGDSTNSGALTLNSETNSKYVKIKAPANSALTSYTLTLPVDDGTSGNVLTTDGSGGLSWALSSMSSADAAKLAGIETGATADQWATNGNDISYSLGNVFIGGTSSGSADIALNTNGTIDAVGAIISGGDPNDGSAVGSKILNSGVIQATRSSGASAVWMGYTQGNATPTSRINGNGSAQFKGRVDVAPNGTGTNADYVSLYESGAVGVRRNSGNDTDYLWTGISGTTETSRINKDGSAVFNGNVTLHADLDMQDNDKILLGSSDDLQIYHDASNSFIHDNGTGDLNLCMESGSKIVIQSGTSGNHIAEFNFEGAAELFHNGTQKLTTTSSGISVTGQIDLGSTTLYDNGNISMGDNDKILLGSSDDLKIYHNGSDSYIQDEGTGALKLISNGAGLDLQKGTSEYLARFYTDGEVELFYDGSKKFDTKSDGCEVIGELECDGLDVDGTADINNMQMLSGNVSQNLKWQPNSSSADVGFSFYNGNGSWCAQLYAEPNGPSYGFLNSNWGSWDLRKIPNGQLTLRIGSSTATVWHSLNDGSGSGLDADNLDGFTWGTPNKDIRATEFYADNWFRNYNGGEGLYNQATGAHFCSDSSGTWTLRDADNFMRLYFKTNGTSDRGSIYATNSNEIGFLNDSGNWSLRCDSTRNVQVYNNFTASGNVTAYSDITLKEDIEVIPNALDKVSEIRGVTYNRKDIEDKPRHAGVIAQEVEKVLPEVVSTNEEGIKSVAYGNLVGLLIESIKELSVRLTALEAK